MNLACPGAVLKSTGNKTVSCLDFILRADSPVKTPCFVLDLQKLRENASILERVQAKTGVKILLALKAFAAFAVFPILSRAFSGPLYGACASSVDEARLGKEQFGGEIHAYAAAWSMAEMRELMELADHITFNSLAQWRKFKPVIQAANTGIRKASPIKCGLRVNPEHSEGAAAIYDPCAPGSRLGIRVKDLAQITEEDWFGKAEDAGQACLDGLHFHTLCEQNADALARTLRVFEQKFKSRIDCCRWLNFGGGHHITRPGYDLDLLESLLVSWKKRYGKTIYLEPGEAVALNAGWLAATVLDVVEADMPVAILDASAACHMPDVLEMPYRPNVWRLGDGDKPYMAALPNELPYAARLAGKSCLAGDVIGEYSFNAPLKPGDMLAFADMAIYSMVKTTTFNGLRLPAIAAFDGEAAWPYRIIREFGYNDFKSRLS